MLIPPFEADAPLIVDPNALLACTAAPERFEAIRRRDAQIFQPLGRIQHPKLPSRNLLNLNRQPTRHFAVPDALGFLIGEGPDHVGL
jgi:hypothetical protein